MVYQTITISWIERGRNRKKVIREEGKSRSSTKIDFIEDLIRKGARVGLKPSDVENMYLWEFNNYVIGYNEKLLRDQEYLVTNAYQTAAFTNSKHKPKKLSYYINKIRNSAKGTNYDKVDVEKSKEIERKIEELKKRRCNNE